MLLSTRATIRALRDIDGLTHRQAEHVIAAGLLGEPEVRGRQRCYADQRIIDLTSPPRLRRADLDAIFPLGAFIARLGAWRGFGATITARANYGQRQRSTNRNSRLTRFTLADAGPWYDHVAGRRLSLGPGYPWTLWGAPVSGPFNRAGLVDDRDLRRIRMLPR